MKSAIVRSHLRWFHVYVVWTSRGTKSCTFSASISWVWSSEIAGSKVTRCLTGMRSASDSTCLHRSFAVVLAASILSLSAGKLGSSYCGLAWEEEVWLRLSLRDRTSLERDVVRRQDGRDVIFEGVTRT